MRSGFLPFEGVHPLGLSYSDLQQGRISNAKRLFRTEGAPPSGVSRFVKHDSNMLSGDRTNLIPSSWRRIKMGAQDAFARVKTTPLR